MLENKLGVPTRMLYHIDHPVGMADLMQFLSLDRPDLKDAPFAPASPPDLAEGKDIFAAIRRHDILLYHPYDSFTPVVNFLRQAAHDPDVLAIKITLYRVGPNSPIVNALMEARENGKAVAALIELKARFDEENNIGWARALEAQGVHVVYGVVGLKVHAKLCMVVRREKGRDPAVHAPRHRQLQRVNQPDLYRFRHVHLRQGDRRRCRRTLQFPHGICPDRAVPETARCPGYPPASLIEKIEREIDTPPGAW